MQLNIRFYVFLMCISFTLVAYAEPSKTDLTERLTVEKDGQRHLYIKKLVGFGEYSAYLDGVNTKIERTGHFDFPNQFKAPFSNLELVLDIAVNADGSLCFARILRSSGNITFDDWSIQTVNQAAPYSHFSGLLAKNADVLHFTRTFTYAKVGRP